MNLPADMSGQRWFKDLVHWFDEDPVTLYDGSTGRRYQLDFPTNLEWVRSRMVYTAPPGTTRRWSPNFVLDCVADQARRLRGEA